MDRYIIFCYDYDWNDFIVDGTSYTFTKFLMNRVMKRFPCLDESFDALHDSEFPLCIVPGCNAHGRFEYSRYQLTTLNSCEKYTLSKERRTCKCNKSRLYKVKQDNLRVVNLERYVIYVYDCGSSEYIYM